MINDKKQVQEWAQNVTKSPYWSDLKEYAYQAIVSEIVKSGKKGDLKTVAALTYEINALDRITQTLNSLSVNTEAIREFYESVIENA